MQASMQTVVSNDARKGNVPDHGDAMGCWRELSKQRWCAQGQAVELLPALSMAKALNHLF